MKKIILTIFILALLLPLTTHASILDNTRGYILLQVEENGEAWFVNPDDDHRYYMKDGYVAYQMMRNFGLGITDLDLNKISAVSNTTEMNNASSVCSSNGLANRLKGNILLQVQENGEAWYVYPKTCRMIYMKDGEAAYEIMRFLGLGITNTNLGLIETGGVDVVELGDDKYYSVVEVIDGDTIKVDIDGAVEKVRLIGFDSPEMDEQECRAQYAKERMKAFVIGNVVRLERDPLNDDRDKYGRLLRHVYLEDGTFVNLKMVELGYSEGYYIYDFSYTKEFKTVEFEAIINQLGLWGEVGCVGEPSGDGLVEVSYIYYDGDEGVTESDEYVLIKNMVNDLVNLNGYTIEDESGKIYTFGDVDLLPNQILTLYTGCGTDTVDTLYWCYTKSAIWNNGGDTAYLKDSSGVSVDSYGY